MNWQRSLPPNAVEIVITEDLTFDKYRQMVLDKVISPPGKKHVVWNLLSVETFPIRYIPKQIALMMELRNVIWKRISKSTILLHKKSEHIKHALQTLFKFYTPQRPVDMVVINNDNNDVCEVVQIVSKKL